MVPRIRCGWYLMSSYYIIDNLFEGVKRSVNFMRKRLGGYANDAPFNPLEAAGEDLGGSSSRIKDVDRKDLFCYGESLRVFPEELRHGFIWFIILIFL